MVPNEMGGKVSLEAIVCATQLDSLVMIELNGKFATCDMHMMVGTPSRLGIYESEEKPES